MSIEALLLIIAAATIITTIIQCIEMWMLVSSSRRTNELLEDPTPLLESIVERMRKDHAFGAAVGSLFVFMGQCAFAEMRDMVAGKIPKLRRPKNIQEALGMLAENLMPRVQEYASNAIANKATEKAGAAAEKVTEGWG